MHLEVDICPMIDSAKEKWGCLEEDKRVALNYAFTDAIFTLKELQSTIIILCGYGAVSCICIGFG
jgi:hypothetical protein